MAHNCSQMAHKFLLGAHKKNKNNGGVSHYKCEYCEKTFSRSSNLKRHQNHYCKAKNQRKEDQEFKKMVEKTILEQSKNIENLIELVEHTAQNGSSNNFNSNNNNSNNTIILLILIILEVKILKC